MTTQSFAQLMEQAAAEGFSNEILPDGPQVLEVTTVRPSTSQKGQPQIGVRLKVVGGPLDGKSLWDNININPSVDTIADDEQRKKAIRGNGFAFSRLAAYGAAPAVVAAATSVEQIASAIVVGARYNAELGHREYGNPKKTYQNVNKVTPLVGTQAPAPSPAPAPAAPPVPVPDAAPAPAAPAPESAPAAAAPPAPPKVPF